MADFKPSEILALIYASIFDFPLTLAETKRYAICDKHTPGVFALKPTIKGQYVILPGQDKLIELRMNRERTSRQKMKKAEKVARKLGLIPNVLGVFVTGNLAMSNADDNDDIDLLIITQANRLWSTRALVTLFLEAKGLRRRPGDTFASNRICANMYLDETALAMPKPKQNLYTAHEVVQVKPLINKNHIYERFLSANSWVTHYLPNFPIPNEMKLRTSYLVPRTSLFESLSYHLQRFYMKRRLTRETISPHAAFFHPRDTGSQVLREYNKRVKHIQNSN